MFGILHRRIPYRKAKYDLRCAVCSAKAVIDLSDRGGPWAFEVCHATAVKEARRLGWARHRNYGWRCPKHKGH